MIDDVNPIKLYEPALATGDEKALLKTHLRLAQHALLWKLSGLSDEDLRGKHHTGLTVSLRWMILTVLLDTARHAGHADVLREEIDGSIGMDPLGASSVADDEEHWRLFRARVTGELDREGWMAYNRARPDYDPSAWESFMERAWGSRDPRTQD